MILTPGRPGHLSLVRACAPVAAGPAARIQLAEDEVLVGVLLGRPYVRTAAASPGSVQVPPLRAAMNFFVLIDEHLVVVDGDEVWLRDVMALHRAGGVESWVVSIGRRPGSDDPSALRAYRVRPTTEDERQLLAGLRLHDLEVLLGTQPRRRHPHLTLVPAPPGRRVTRSPA